MAAWLARDNLASFESNVAIGIPHFVRDVKD
jgi:hypothetical protein